MPKRFQSSKFIFSLSLASAMFAGAPTLADNHQASGEAKAQDDKRTAIDAHHDDQYWKNKLDPWVFKVTRCAATEPPFTGKYWDNHQAGIYRCSNCGATLFDSKDKFESGTGWPSFTRAVNGAVADRPDNSLFMSREEVICKYCGAHLGHVFDDGPAPTGKRFCINSASLNFQSAAKTAPESKSSK